jgi:hypothetical protein
MSQIHMSVADQKAFITALAGNPKGTITKDQLLKEKETGKTADGRMLSAQGMKALDAFISSFGQYDVTWDGHTVDNTIDTGDIDHKNTDLTFDPVTQPNNTNGVDPSDGNFLLPPNQPQSNL